MSRSRQLAAIMFTDIVGYTALMGEDEENAFELLKKNRTLQRPIIEKYQGKWLKELGDGVLASFSTVSDAVYCAAEIQQTSESDPNLNLRIGIHQGEVIFENNDVFGDGVNIASRLEPLAPIGGILVSESVHRNLGNKRNIVSTFVGEEQLKNLKEPIRVYSVQVEGLEPLVAAVSPPTQPQLSSKSNSPRKTVFASLAIIILLAVAYFFYSQRGEAEPQVQQLEVIDRSIAVLPFKNDSQDYENQYFCDGMMDEILNHLQKIAELGVKSRAAVEPYRNTTLAFSTIADELDVAFVLEGAVRKYGERFRVTTQLIEVASGNHLWSETYDGIFSDTIFLVQSNIAKKIAASLNTAITPDVEERIDIIPTTDIAAYDLYVRAIHEKQLFWKTYDPNHLKRSHNLLDEAIQIDPTYLKAIAAKGSTFAAEANYDSALVYADKVLAVDPKFSSAYQLKAECYTFMGNFDLAIENYRTVIKLGESDQWSYVGLGRSYLAKAEIIKALPYLQEGLKRDKNSDGANFWIAMAYYNMGDYEKAAKYFQSASEQGSCIAFYFHGLTGLTQGDFQKVFQLADSTFQSTECKQECSRLLFQASLYLGEFKKAEQYFYQWQQTGQDPFWEVNMNCEFGYVSYKLGRVEEAEKIFSEQIERVKLLKENEFISPLARIYAFKGMKDEALNILERYAEKGFSGGHQDFILIDPFFESLRDDPEFKAIVKNAQEEKAVLRAKVREMEARGELTL